MHRAGVFRTPTETDDVGVAVMRFQKRGNSQITSTVSAFGEERSRVTVYGSDLTAVSHGSAAAASSEPFRLSARTSRGRGGAAGWTNGFHPGIACCTGGRRGFLDAVRDGREPLSGPRRIPDCPTGDRGDIQVGYGRSAG